jgi:hypothetical protein
MLGWFADAIETGRMAGAEAERAAHAADQERIRSALKHIRGVALGYTGDEASKTDPFNALSTIVLTVDEALALLRAPAATDPLAPPAPVGELDVERRLIATTLLDAVAADLDHRDGFHPGEDCAWWNHRDAVRAAYNGAILAARLTTPVPADA